MPVMIQLHSVEEENEQEDAKIERTVGVDLVCVIDHSGSMGCSNKMQLAV